MYAHTVLIYVVLGGTLGKHDALKVVCARTVVMCVTSDLCCFIGGTPGKHGTLKEDFH